MDENKHYLGIPRLLIPWHPGIDADACTSCGVCVDACKHGVYAFDDGSGKAVVANPYECEVEAISFPDKAAMKAVVKALRQQYPPR